MYCRYLFGMHAFGLEETNFYREAEKQARKVIFAYNKLYLKKVKKETLLEGYGFFYWS